MSAAKQLNCQFRKKQSIETMETMPHPPLLTSHLDMHHLIFGINFQIHSISLILVLIYLLIHL